MNLEGQYNKLTKSQIYNLKHVACLANITKNYKLWRKYWAIKKEYLLEYERKVQLSDDE